MKNKHNYDVFDQNCSDYLKSLGINIEDGVRINAPYRCSADSESFVTNGPLWYDHSHGEGGNVWKLALKMNNGNHKEALKSLYASAGLIFNEKSSDVIHISERDKAEAALLKIRDEFIISNKTQNTVIQYLEKRKVSKQLYDLLAFIPDHESLSRRLNDEEIRLTGIKSHVGRLILWYQISGKPVYFASRSIIDKDFRKASLEQTPMNHPIWNRDDLYLNQIVVWGEGFFDGLSLLGLGYGCCGEVTCNISERHYHDLLKALRWRAKEHPGWEFVICLDNDEEKNGRRAGNEAAEKLACRLWGDGINCKVVIHDPAAVKIDINQMCMEGKERDVERMVESARHLSDIFSTDIDLLARNVALTLNHCDYKTADTLINVLHNKHGKSSFSKLIDSVVQTRRPWRDFYENIDDIFIYDGIVYVVFYSNKYGYGNARYDIKQKANLVNELISHQRNKAFNLNLQMLHIPCKRPEWRVSKQHNQPDAPVYNLFIPSPHLLQNPVPDAVMPKIYSLLLDNLAGPQEREWLLNHMAYYTQKLEKMPTIPVFLSRPGTGKNTLMSLFGIGIGGFCRVDIKTIESQFNEWLMTPVILLDELVSCSKDAYILKNIVKGLSNEEQCVNVKQNKLMKLKINNYIAVASNEQTTYPPVIIEQNDRRYTIICGGKDKKVDDQPWFDYDELLSELPNFMLYLLSRPIDIKSPFSPLINEKKMELMGLGEDFRITIVREWIENGHYCKNNTEKLSSIVNSLNELKTLKSAFTSKTLKPILMSLGYRIEKQHKQDVVVGISTNYCCAETSSSSSEENEYEYSGNDLDPNSPNIASTRDSESEELLFDNDHASSR